MFYKFTLTAKTELHRHGEPVTCGVPWPKGILQKESDLRLFDESGNIVTLQTRVLDHWRDGSVRWVLCEWQADFPKNRTYRLKIGKDHPKTANTDLIRTNLEEVWGALKRFSLIVEARDPEVPEEAGDEYKFFKSEVKFASGLGIFPDFSNKSSSEPIKITGEGVKIYLTRLPNSGVFRITVTLTNPLSARHPGGCWDLGYSSSWWFRSASLQINLLPGSTSFLLSPEPGSPFQPIPAQTRILQESSGGENWRSTNHINADRKIDVDFRGYRIATEPPQEGLRACPILIAQNAQETIAVSYPHFWQNFPKAMKATPEGIQLELFPDRGDRDYELQGGEQKTHTFYIAFGKDTITETPLEWTRDPLIPTVDPEWVAFTRAIPYLTPKSQDIHRDYLQLVDAAIEGEDTFEKKREVIDEYGWRHFGDIYGDHEAILHPEFPPQPRVSHYNNQYDATAGFGYQWLRSGDSRWFHMMQELAWHVVDIDIYHTDGDKSAYNHGLFWHTYHYVDADTGTHRSYPEQGKIPPHGQPVPGGGPSNEQNYATGLMQHYFLTGDEASKEAAVGLAQWVIDMDDGRRTIFGWLTSADTGLASQSRTPDYHGPGRGAANSISVLLDGHRLTRKLKFLEKAEQIIRRSIHPKDNIPARNLIDAENRWFYTMFLQALGKYLDYQAERGELDIMVAYARESLLAYARWMLENEYPYLQRRDLLEYPTETWAAQDLRKCEVFYFASMHSIGEERDRFLHAARFFFNTPVLQLTMMETRTLCRPVVLLLSHGWMHNWFRLHPEEVRSVPIQTFDFGEPEEFVPQKVIAIKRAKMIALGLLISGITLLVWRIFH